MGHVTVRCKSGVMRCGDGAEAYAMRWGGRVEVVRRVGDGVKGTRGEEEV
jgi:hypothetical protein